jgi:hypothetical protein
LPRRSKKRSYQDCEPRQFLTTCICNRDGADDIAPMPEHRRLKWTDWIWAKQNKQQSIDGLKEHFAQFYRR